MNPDAFLDVLTGMRYDSIAVIDILNTGKNYVPIDISVTSEALKAVDLSSSKTLNTYIIKYLDSHGAEVAFGGYLEERNLYKRSSYFSRQNLETDRNIHLGIDLWCKAGVGVLAVLAGVVHSFKNNTNPGDYGPTIILKHNIEGVEFYTLYGHLSLASIETIKVGQYIKQGEKIGVLGAPEVNGDYPPHLHFQIIKNIQGLEGDYPGVSSKKDLEFYRSNCPDPNLLLKLKN